MFPDIKSMKDEDINAKMYEYWNSLEEGFAIPYSRVNWLRGHIPEWQSRLMDILLQTR